MGGRKKNVGGKINEEFKVGKRRRTIRGMKFHTCRVEFLTTRGGGGRKSG